MVTKPIRLTPVGGELALAFDQETLDALGYTIDTVVDVRVEGASIVIERVRDPGPAGRPPPSGPPAAA